MWVVKSTFSLVENKFSFWETLKDKTILILDWGRVSDVLGRTRSGTSGEVGG